MGKPALVGRASASSPGKVREAYLDRSSARSTAFRRLSLVCRRMLTLYSRSWICPFGSQRHARTPQKSWRRPGFPFSPVAYPAIRPSAYSYVPDPAHGIRADRRPTVDPSGESGPRAPLMTLARAGCVPRGGVGAAECDAPSALSTSRARARRMRGGHRRSSVEVRVARPGNRRRRR